MYKTNKSIFFFNYFFDDGSTPIRFPGIILFRMVFTSANAFATARADQSMLFRTWTILDNQWVMYAKQYRRWYQRCAQIRV